jgi:hypothetical protein
VVLNELGVGPRRMDAASTWLIMVSLIRPANGGGAQAEDYAHSRLPRSYHGDWPPGRVPSGRPITRPVASRPHSAPILRLAEIPRLPRRTKSPHQASSGPRRDEMRAEDGCPAKATGWRVAAVKSIRRPYRHRAGRAFPKSGVRCAESGRLQRHAGAATPGGCLRSSRGLASLHGYVPRLRPSQSGSRPVL